MMLSVMVMGAGAAFTDQDKIVNEEAVDMCAALNIINGYEDDSYRPEGNITRAETTKLIAMMLNGGRDTSLVVPNDPSFSDVRTSPNSKWAEKYIEYCAAAGIVCGWDGIFAPDNNVTGTEAAKMLLVSLGYDAVKEGFEGAQWAVNVNVKATQVGLYDGLKTMDVNAPLTRDNAAQMIWNALNAEVVKYSSAGQAIGMGYTLLNDAYDAGDFSGIMTNVKYNRDTKVYTYTVDPTPGAGADSKTFTSKVDYTDKFAMDVTVVNKGTDALNIFAPKAATVVEGTIGDIENVTGTKAVKVNGTQYNMDSASDYKTIARGFNQYYEDGTGYDAYEQYAFRAIDQDGGGDIDAIVVYPFAVMQTNNVKTDSFQINAIAGTAYLTAGGQSDWLIGKLNASNNVVKYNNVIVNGEIAIDGYAMVVPAEYTAVGMDTYTVLSAQTDKVTSASAKDTMITFGNTEYNGTLLGVDSVNKVSVGSSYSFIEVNGYLFVVDGAGIVPAATNYVVVTAVEQAANKAGMYETDLLMSNGETKTVEAQVQDDHHTFYNDPADRAYVGTMYTYSVDKDGNYLLTRVADGSKATVTSVFDDQNVYKVGATVNAQDPNKGATGFVYNAKGAPCINNTLVEDDAVVFAFIDRASDDLRGDDYVVLKGSDLKDLTAANIKWAFTGETTKSQNVSTIDMAYIYMDGDMFDTTQYAYVVDGSVRYDGHYVSVNVKTADGEKTLTTASYLDQKVLKDLYNNLENAEKTTIEVTLDKDGKLVGFDDVTMTATGKVTAYDKNSGFITIDGKNFLIDADTVIINVDGNQLQTNLTVEAYGTVNETLDLLVVH